MMMAVMAVVMVVAVVVVVVMAVAVVVVRVMMVSSGCTFDNFITSSESNFSASRKAYDASKR
jgi:hypothetical protein